MISCSLTVTPLSVEPGEMAMLSWTSEGAHEAYLNGMKLPVNCTMPVWPSTMDNTYELIVNGEEGESANQMVTVPVTPVPAQAALWASANACHPGTSVILEWWSLFGSQGVTLNGDAVAESGSMEVFPEEGMNTYTLIAYGETGEPAVSTFEVECVPVTPASRSVPPMEEWDEYFIDFQSEGLNSAQWINSPCGGEAGDFVVGSELTVPATVSHDLPPEIAQYFPLLCPVAQVPEASTQAPAWNPAWGDRNNPVPWVHYTDHSEYRMANFFRPRYPGLTDAEIISRNTTPGYPNGYRWVPGSPYQPGRPLRPGPAPDNGLVCDASTIINVCQLYQLGVQLSFRICRTLHAASSVGRPSIYELGVIRPPERVIILRPGQVRPDVVPPNTTIIFREASVAEQEAAILTNLRRTRVIVNPPPTPPPPPPPPGP